MPVVSSTTAKKLTHTHKRLKGLLPVASSALALFGAAAAFLDGAEETKEKSEKSDKADKLEKKDGKTTKDEELDMRPSYSFLDHLFTLIHHLAAALGFILGISALLFFAFVAPPVSTTLVLTTLVMLVFWLSEVASRNAR